MKELATTAERKARQYTDKQGITRNIKGRPSRKGVLPFGESTIYEMVRRGTFPKAHQLSSRVVAWRATDIAEWLQSKELTKN